MSEHPRFIQWNDYREVYKLAEINDSQCKLLIVSDDQLEIIRRAMKSVRKRSNWVDQEDADGYLTPDDDDWDDISSLIDDLEYKLMSICDYLTLDDANSRVGIRETSPGTALDIKGGLNLQTGGWFAATGKHIEIYMPNVDDVGRINVIDRTYGNPLKFQIYAAGGTKFSAGDVGIGKDPGYPLDVNGAAQIGGAFGCNGQSPQTAAALPADATDLTSALALVNAIAAALVANGIAYQ